MPTVEEKIQEALDTNATRLSLSYMGFRLHYRIR